MSTFELKRGKKCGCTTHEVYTLFYMMEEQHVDLNLCYEEKCPKHKIEELSKKLIKEKINFENCKKKINSIEEEMKRVYLYEKKSE